MQQLSRVCEVTDHEQRQIEYYCMYPECTLSRLVCSQCQKLGTHKHSQQDQSHILDDQELYDVLFEKLNQRQNSVKFQAEGLKNIIKECKTLFNSIRIMIEQMKIFMDQSYNNLGENQLLERLKTNGYNQIDDIQLNILMNIGNKVNIFTQLSEQSNEIIQNSTKIQEWCNSQQSLLKTLYFNKYKLIVQDTGEDILSSTVSIDLKYIVGGGTKVLKIWQYNTNQLIKTIQLDDCIYQIKFTDDSKFLYVVIEKILYQFDVDNNFKQIFKQNMNLCYYSQIICITNTIILAFTTEQTITKTDIILNQQILSIKVYEGDVLLGLDHDNNLNMIASSDSNKYIKIWNENNGELVLQKFMNDQNYKILFFSKGKQLICQQHHKIIIYNINYETQQFEEYQQICESDRIYNLSLVLNQEYISLVHEEYIKIYSIKGNLIRQFNHGAELFVQHQYDPFPKIIQPPSIKAFIILGFETFWIFKQDID